MQQIVDLQNDPAFQETGVQVLSIAADPVSVLALEAAALGITDIPLLSDSDLQVSTAYDILQYATPGGEPSHTFVLVDADGLINAVRDYGAPDNPNRTMYVEIEELVDFVQDHLN